MNLLDFEPQKRPVCVAGKTIAEVRGLSTADLTYILEIHREQVIRAVMTYKAQKESIFTPKGSEKMTLALLTQFPALAAEVISVAAGIRSQEGAKKAASLPFTTQASALADILVMTFDDAGGLKNLFATLATIIRGMFPEDVRSALLESLTAVALKNAPSET